MNKWLTGNGVWCPICKGSGRGEALDRIIYEGGGYAQFYALCPACKGQRRIAANLADVIAGCVSADPSHEPRSCFLPLIEYGRERQRV